MTTINQRFFHLSPMSPAHSRLEEAERFFLEGNFNEGLAAAQQAWREHPQDPDVYRVLAYIHMARGEYPPAAQAAYQSVVIDGHNPASYATLVQVYVTFNMLGYAEESLKTARGQFAEDATLLVLEADLRFRQQQDDQGARLARAALHVNAHDAYAQALLGVYALKRRNYYQADECLRAAVHAYPKRWDYLRDLGIAQLHLGKYSDARDALTRSVSINPTDLSAKQYLYYAVRFTAGRMRDWLSVSLFFYNHLTLAWMLLILGSIAALIGLTWGSVAMRIHGFSFDAVGVPGLFLLGGTALMVLSTPGLLTRGKKGKKFDLFLWKEVKDDAEAFMRAQAEV